MKENPSAILGETEKLKKGYDWYNFFDVIKYKKGG